MEKMMHVFGTTAKIGIFFHSFPFFYVYFAYSFAFFLNFATENKLLSI